jgi:hypothetical protein
LPWSLENAVVVGKVAGDRLFQDRELAAHGAQSHLREDLRIPLAGGERGQHLPTGNAEEMSLTATLILIWAS